MKPLAGVRVLVLAGMGPGPFVGMLLADMGADVVRIDRPARGQSSVSPGQLPPGIDPVERGIQSLTVDLKTSSGLDTVRRLVSYADVFVEGYRPGVLERLGLAPDSLLELRPSLVVARLTGYGQSGPLSQSAGHDINYVAQTGLLHALGAPGHAPRPPINLLGDYAGGGAVAAFGIVSALLSARTTGAGTVLDAAMIDGVALLTAKLQGLRAAGFLSDQPGTSYLDGAAPYYGVYQCRDGRYLAVGALEPVFYQEFLALLECDTTGWPEQEDSASWPTLRRLIAAEVRSRSLAEWTAVFEGTDACVTPVLTFDEASRHPHNAARGVYFDVDGVQHPASAPRVAGSSASSPPGGGSSAAHVHAVMQRWSSQAPAQGDGRDQE